MSKPKSTWLIQIYFHEIFLHVIRGHEWSETLHSGYIITWKWTNKNQSSGQAKMKSTNVKQFQLQSFLNILLNNCFALLYKHTDMGAFLSFCNTNLLLQWLAKSRGWSQRKPNQYLQINCTTVGCQLSSRFNLLCDFCSSSPKVHTPVMLAVLSTPIMPDVQNPGHLRYHLCNARFKHLFTKCHSDAGSQLPNDQNSTFTADPNPHTDGFSNNYQGLTESVTSSSLFFQIPEAHRRCSMLSAWQSDVNDLRESILAEFWEKSWREFSLIKLKACLSRGSLEPLLIFFLFLIILTE